MVRIEPSAPLLDAPCPNCGRLILFTTSEDVARQTRRRIRELVTDVLELARSDVTLPVFCERFLRDVHEAVAAVCAELWTVGQDGRPQFQRRVNRVVQRMEVAEVHKECLDRVLVQGASVLVEDEPWLSATGCVMVVAPIKVDDESIGAVALFLDRTRRQTALQNAAVFVGELCQIASGYFLRQRYRAMMQAMERATKRPWWRFW
jgi:hypothetical protein